MTFSANNINNEFEINNNENSPLLILDKDVSLLLRELVKHKEIIKYQLKEGFTYISVESVNQFVINIKQSKFFRISISKYAKRNMHADLIFRKMMFNGISYSLCIDKGNLVNSKVTIKQLRFNFKSQSLISNIKCAYSGFKKILDYASIVNDRLPSLDEAKEFLRINGKVLGVTLVNAVLGIFSLHSMMMNPLSNFSLIQFVSVVVQILSSFVLATSMNDFKSQSGLAGGLMSAVLQLVGVPKKIKDLLVLCLTSAGSIFSLVDKIMEILIYVTNFVLDKLKTIFPNSEILDTIIKWFRDFSYDFDVDAMVEEMLVVLKSYYQSPMIISQPGIRQKFADALDKVLKHPNFARAKTDPLKRNFSAVYGDLVAVIKNCESYECTERVVPAMIVLEGPGGCGKSTIMNKVIKCMTSKGMTTYSHVWKTSMEGKDFYDDYNNQDIMVLDDVGQGGNGQWAKTMNFVSSVKLPLDCAVAEKKNSKFFTSKAIICTTNLFTTINNITKDDCIADREALFRRPVVFLVKKSVQGDYRVDVEVKYYSIEPNDKGWRTGYLPGFLSFMQEKAKNWSNKNGGAETRIPLNMVGITHDQAAGLIFNVTKALIEYNELVFENTTQPIDVENSPMGFLSQSAVRYDITTDTIVLPEPLNTYDARCDIDNEVVQLGLHKVQERWIDKMRKFLKCVSKVVIETGEKIAELVVDNPIIAIIIPGLFTGFLSLGIFLLRKYYEENITPLPIINTSGFSVQGCTFGDGPLDSQKINAAQKCMKRLIFKHKGLVGNELVTCMGVVSGNKLLTTRHSCVGARSLDMYESEYHYHSNTPLLENCTFNVLWEDIQSDLIICKLNIPTSVFPKARSIFSSIDNTVRIRETSLLSADGIHPVNATHLKMNNEALKVASIEAGTKVQKIFPPGTGLFYEYSRDGLCGSVLFDRNLGMVGIHVAGNGESGFVVIPSKDSRSKISEIMLAGPEYSCGVSSIPEGSGMRIRYTAGEIAPRTPLRASSLVPTGAPVMCSTIEKIPPVFVEDNKSKLKKLSLANFKVSKTIDYNLVDFATGVIKKDFKKYKSLTWKEVIMGNPEKGIPALNKKSVNGYGYENDKLKYLNFETGEVDPVYMLELEDFGNQLLRGEIDMDKAVCYHALKDELRPRGKEPRTFSVLPLHYTLWTKKLFGELAAHVKKHRHVNGIALGLNPYKEWGIVWNNLTSGSKYVFDGDVKGWDKDLVVQLLEAGGISMASFNDNAEDVIRAKNIIYATLRIFVLLQDELYVPTHGMQSGCWLTAFLNSVVNKMISACTFKKNYKGNKPEFDFARIREYFLGDDRISGVPPDLIDVYNMLTLDEFFQSIGMSLTDGKKQKITTKYLNPSEISFLKRTFIVGDSEISNMYGPISKDTLGNLFSYVDCTKDLEQVMSDRSVVFQIEKYLHKADPDLDEYQRIMEEFFLKRNFVWRYMSEDRIREILNEEDGYSQMMFHAGKYDGTF